MVERVKFHDRIYEQTVLRLVPLSITPNQITLFRLVCTPIVVALAVAQAYVLALIFFLVLAFSDTVDGSLARVRNQVTTWGKVFDPIADKVLVGSLIIVLVMQRLSVGLALVLLSIELLFLIFGWWKIKRGVEVSANRFGKAKMFLQVLGVTLLFLGIITGFHGLYHISAQTFYLAIVFAVVSLFAAGF